MPTVQPVTGEPSSDSFSTLQRRSGCCPGVRTVVRYGVSAYDQNTMERSDLARRAEELTAAREPFVTALVVRAKKPSSVTAGASAVRLAAGTIEGLVGGSCADPSVGLQELRVPGTGEPLVLRIVP